MARLTLQLAHIQQIRTHGERTYPEECCGLLLGQCRGDEKTLIEIWQTENSWSDRAADAFQIIDSTLEKASTKRRRFTIAPQAMLKAQKAARTRQLEIIGVYHSHPDYPAVPSEFDQAIAWPQYSYIIVSIKQGQAGDLNCWSLDANRQFQPEELLTQ